MKRFILLFTLLLSLPALSAETTDSTSKKPEVDYLLRLDMRGDVNLYFDQKGEYVKQNSGFRGTYVILKFDLNVGEHFSFNYRQRLNKITFDQSFFDSFDFLSAQWKFSNGLFLKAGKMASLLGGEEFDMYVLDVYYFSEGLNFGYASFTWNAAAGYTTPDKRSTLTFSFSESYLRDINHKGIFGLNLHWTANYGPWVPTWSVNFHQGHHNDWVNTFSIGNKFQFDRFKFYVDLTERTPLKEYTFMQDFSLVGQFFYSFLQNKSLTISLKGAWDRNSHSTDPTTFNCEGMPYMYFLQPGTSIFTLSGGIEFWPIEWIRLHLMAGHSFGTAPADVAFGFPPGTTQAMIGMTLKLPLLPLPSFLKKK